MDIDYPGFGNITVAGSSYDHDVVIDQGRVRKRDKGPSRPKSRGHTPLSADEDLPWSGGRLVIGSGHSGRLPVLPEVHDEASARAVELVVIPTAEACALLRNIDPADANAVLHVTC